MARAKINWIRKIGVPSQMPKGIKPMQPYLISEPFSSSDWLFELKWDGIRAIAYLVDKNLSLLSRNQKEQNFRYPELSNLGHSILGGRAVLDGEVVAFDKRGLPSFEVLQSRINLNTKTEIDYYSKKIPVIYYVFDVLHWQGRNLMALPLVERKKVLESVVLPHQHIQISDYVDGQGEAFFSLVKEYGLEGMLAKKKSSFYEQKRSRNWLKIKAVLTQEAVIGGFTEPRGRRQYFGSLLLGVYKDSQLAYIGHTGTGFSERTLKELYDEMVKIERVESPFKEEPKTNEKAHWIEPKLVAQVKFSEWTKAGKLRQASFKGLRRDIEAKKVVREQFPPPLTSPRRILRGGD